MDFRHVNRLALALGLSAFGAGCGEVAGGDSSQSGQGLQITVAPLALPGIVDASYRIVVTNGSGQVVWERPTLTSQSFGDGAGALTYVGTCDASDNPNHIALTMNGLTGAAGPLGAGDWQNPTADGALVIDATCYENRDTAVVFNLTVMRAASQGFFDVAVTFDDIFCSAKFDCEGDGGQPPKLLHKLDGSGRGDTFVMAFACTSGQGQDTHLYMTDLSIACAGGVNYTVGPDGGPGNMGAVAPGLFQTATYRGLEDFTSVDKCYWNTALGVDLATLGDSCVLTATATASSAAFELGVTPTNTSWPVVRWNVPLTGADGGRVCANHPMNGGVEVATDYTSFGSNEAFPHSMSCSDGAGGEPAVQGLSNNRLSTGDSLEINGTGFGNTPGTVTFEGGVDGTVETWTDTRITTTVPADGISGELTVTTDAGDVIDGPYFGYDDVAPAPIATLNATAYSIFDLDFDGLGNAYYAEYISGQDDMHRVAPDGTKTTYHGISNWNLGFGAPSWDGTWVSGSYSWSVGAQGVILVDSGNVMQMLFVTSVGECTSWTITGYALCGPMDPEWGFDGFFYAGNLNFSGELAKYNPNSLAPETVATFPAFVTSVAPLSNQRLWVSAGTKLYEVDKTDGTVTELADFGSITVSISASALHQRIYAETVDGTIWEVTWDGIVSPFVTGLTKRGFLTVGPDFTLYRIEGAVNAYSTITSYTL